MEFVADPGIVDVVRLLELVNNALADIAEWSDVVGKDSYVDAHLMPSLLLRWWIVYHSLTFREL